MSDIPRMRRMLDELAGGQSSAMGFEPVQHRLAQDVVLYEFVPRQGESEAMPTLLWFHGGGYVMGQAWHDHVLCQRIADQVACRVFSCDYPLAPEHPYPAALSAANGAWQHLQNEAHALGIDRQRVAVGGASAGAGLAASLCLYLRDHASPDAQPCMQWLMYPMLDARNIEIPAVQMNEPPLLWSRECNRMAWQAFLGGRHITEISDLDQLVPYFSPSMVDQVVGLPATFIAIGDIDLFYEECKTWCQRLQEAGVSVEFHAFAGAPHAFDVFAPDAEISKKFEALRWAALSRALKK